MATPLRTVTSPDGPPPGDSGLGDPARGADHRAGAEHVAEIAGSRLHYWTYHEAAAGAATIVGVHGFRGTHHGLELIARHLPGHRVVLPDLPGFGASTPIPDRTHDTDGFADALISLLRDRFPGPIVLCGHSFGSVIAARVAAREPELCARLVLINAIAEPPLGGPGTPLSRLADAYYQLGETLPEQVAQPLLAGGLVVRVTGEVMLRSRDRDVRRLVHRSHREHFSSFQNRTVLREAYRASARGKVAEDAPAVRVPTLLIAGERDGIAPLAGQRALLEALPDGRLVTVPGVGHLVHYETPKPAADAIAEFVAEDPDLVARGSDPPGDRPGARRTAG